MSSGLIKDRAELDKWLLVFVSNIGVLVSMLYIYAVGAFVLPLEEEFGWSRTTITSGITIISVIAVVMAPLVGATIDKYGPRKIALVGMVIFCAAYASLSTATGAVWNWILIWVFIAFGDILIKPVVWMSAIASRFVERRGLAMGIAMSGTGIAAAILPLIATLLIESGGWRFAFMVLGIGGAAISLPLMLLFFHAGEKKAPSPSPSPSQSTEELPGLTVREGLRTVNFYKLCVACLLMATGIFGLAVHYIPIMEGGGLTSTQSATIAGLVGIASMIGRVGTGFLLDKLPGPVVGGIGFGLPIIACAMLLFTPGSMVGGAIAALVLGLSVGAEIDIAAYLSAGHFGRRKYATLFGTIAGMIALGAGVGAMYLGAMYDFFESYDTVLWTLIPMFAIGSLLVASTGSYPDFSKPEEASS